MKEAKESYRRKVEHKLMENNMREVLVGVKIITGHKAKNSTEGGTVERANQLNIFFNRFDQPSPLAPSQGTNIMAPSLSPPSCDPPFPSPLDTALHPPVTNLSSNTPVDPPPCIITADQVRGELRKLRPKKAAGPDNVCSRLLKTCAAELGEPLQHVFNLSLQLGRVPTLWKTSCIVPVPKKTRPTELNDFRPVALTSHLMKTLERLLLRHLRPKVLHAQDPLQFAYRTGVGVEDAILYLLHRAHSHLDKGAGTVRILFLDFSSAFNTIQPLILQNKLSAMQVDPHLITWITNYLIDRPQFVRLKDTTSDILISSTGAPQGTVLAPLPFTLYTSDL